MRGIVAQQCRLSLLLKGGDQPWFAKGARDGGENAKVPDGRASKDTLTARVVGNSQTVVQSVVLIS